MHLVPKPPLPTTPQALTVAQVADALKISRFKVYDLLRSGQIRSFTIGRARRIPADEIPRYMHNNMQEAA